MGALRVFSGIAFFAWSIIYLFIVVPVLIVFAFLDYLVGLLRSSPILFLLVAVAIGGAFIGSYHDRFAESTDYVFRCVIWPVVEGTVLKVLNIVRTIYNPLICSWNATNWFAFGYFNNVLVPSFLACGIEAVFVDLGCMITQFFESFAFYIATGEFLVGAYDMSSFSASIVQLVDDWILLCCCLCQDVCCIVRNIPIFLPLPPPLGFIIAGLMPQYMFWQSLESLVNAVAALLRILWPLVIDLLNFTSPRGRPSVAEVSKYLCQFFDRLNIALERAMQRVWDTFVPLRVNFEGTLCWATTAACIIIDSVDVVLTVLINPDVLVFNIFTPAPNTYVGPGYPGPIDIWRGQIKTTILRIFNSNAPLSDPDFFVDVHAFNRRPMTECLCILITRVICDPAGLGTGSCFNNDPGFAGGPSGGFLAGFNFCCFTNAVITGINDGLKGVYGMFLHTTSAADWFEWLDTQPDTAIQVTDLVNLARCVFSVVDAVPVVGYCLKNIFVQLFAFAVSVVEFIIKLLIGLVTLIWDFLAGTQHLNFLLGGEKAIKRWEEIVDILLANEPDSLLNCVSYVLNFGIQIPPITLDNNAQLVTCPNPVCVPVNYIPPPPVINRRLSDVNHLVDWGDGHLDKSFTRAMTSRVTPLMSYQTERALNHSWFHPQFLRERLVGGTTTDEYAARHLPDAVTKADAFFDAKVTEFRARRAAIDDCHRDALFKDRLRREDPWRFKLLTAENKLPDTSHCVGIGAYDNVLPGATGRQQRTVLLGHVRAFGLYDAYGVASVPSPSSSQWGGVNKTFYASEVFLEDLDDSDDSDDTYGLRAGNMARHTGRILAPPDPLTTRPTTPPINGCPGPGEPPNPCFDLACFPRTALRVVGTIFLIIPHILDGLIRGAFPDTAAGEVAWGYFIGANCAKRCLEGDFMHLIIYAIDSFVCACKLLTLMLPSSPNFPQPDFCCILTRLADFIVNSIQVLINGIKSLALDSPQFIYFNDGYFVRDINELFDELLGISVCICRFLRYIFPISQLTGGTIEDGGGAFDICCIPMTVFDSGIEFLRLIVLMIVNLATIEGRGILFWRTAPSQPTIGEIGFVVQVDKLLDTFFGNPGGICASRGRPQGVGGIGSCICQILALIIPIRDRPGEPISETNCPLVDLCCPIRAVLFLLKDLGKFGIRGLASTWQSWDPADNDRCGPGQLPPGSTCATVGNQPYAFLDYAFCNELTPDQIANPSRYGLPPTTPQLLLQQRKCGKFLPIIDSIAEIIASCPCQFLALADAWLATYFTGFDCFCGPVNGLFPNLGDLVKAVLTSVITLLRRINDVSYWQPFGRPSSGMSDNLFMQDRTWTFQFFGPIIDAICNVVASVTCFFDILLPFCKEQRQRIVRSIVRWVLEAIILIGAFIEGFIGYFTSGSKCGEVDQNGDVVVCPSNSGSYGVTVAALADAFTSLAAFPANAFLGDSQVVCSTLNPPQCPIGDRCCCYNPDMLPEAANFIHVTTIPMFPDPDAQCFLCLNDDCTAYADSFAYPTCALQGAPELKCFEEGEPGLVSCDAANRDLTKLDGIIMAFLRYFQCLLGMLLPAFVRIFQGLIIVVSVVWQYLNPILRVIAAVFMFIFGILINAGQGGCACYGQFQDFRSLCYQCQNLYVNSPYMCKVVQTFPLQWQTHAFPIGHVFLVGQTFPCGDLAYSRACLAGGGTQNDQLSARFGVKTDPVDVNGNCVETSYTGFIEVTNPPPGIPVQYIWTDSTYFHPSSYGNDPLTGVPWATNGDEYRCAEGPGGIGRVTCSVITFVTNFLAIFEAITQVFEQGPVIPEEPVFKRGGPGSLERHVHLQKLENRTAFKARMEKGRTHAAAHKRLVGDYPFLHPRGHVLHQDPSARTGADLITDVLNTVWGFSTEDCMYDVSTCLCRNMHLDRDTCTIAMRKRDTGASTIPVLTAVGEQMTGSTSCDYQMRRFMHNRTWDSVSAMDKAYYVDCLDKVVQSGRLNEANPMIPHDMFYRHDGYAMLWENIRSSVARSVDSDHRDTVAHHAREHAREPEKLTLAMARQRMYKERREQTIRYVSTHPRWKKSMIASALVEFDMFEFKATQGHYAPMIKDAYANVMAGNFPRVSMRSRFSLFKKHAGHAAMSMYGVQLRQAFGEIFGGLSEIPEALRVLKTKSIMDLYWDARARHDEHNRDHGADRERELLRNKTREAMQASPLYKWWFGTWSEQEKRSSPSMPAPEAPFSRLARHIAHVFNWHRANWNRTEPNLFTADLHMRRGVEEFISNRFRLTWTPEIRSNWASAARLYRRMREAIWPEERKQISASALNNNDNDPRFSVGPNCAVDWNKRAEMLRAQPPTLRTANGVGTNCVNASAYMRAIQERNVDFIMNGFKQAAEAGAVSHVPTPADHILGYRGFLIDGNCVLMDGFIDQFLFLVTYCANEFMPQLPPFKRAELTTGNTSWAFWRFMEDMAQRGKRMYDSEREVPAPVIGGNTSEMQTGEWTTWTRWFVWRGQRWRRTRVPHIPHPNSVKRATFMQRVSHQQWLRATATASFDIFDWVLSVIDSFAGTRLGYEVRAIVEDIQDFVDNTNEDYMAGPVGLKYWLLKPARCVFQPRPGQLASNAALDFNCKIGIGLEAAIGWVGFVMIVAYTVGAMVLPIIPMLIGLIGAPLVVLIMVPLLAWGYSPRCWFMTPALPIPGFGISIPILPIPIALPALPFCAMDEIYALVAKYGGNCWCQVWWGTWLEFLCPPYMLRGNPCPPCPQRIFLDNCKDLGFSPGLDNVIYVFVRWVPEAGNVMTWIAQTAPFTGHWGETLARAGDHIVAHVARLQAADGVLLSQYGFCSGITVFAVASYAVILIVGIGFIVFVLRSGVLIAGGVTEVVYRSPLGYLLPGTGSDPYQDIVGSAPTPGSVPSESASYVGVRISTVTDPVTGARRRVALRRQAPAAIGSSIDTWGRWAASHLKTE